MDQLLYMGTAYKIQYIQSRIFVYEGTLINSRSIHRSKKCCDPHEF